MTETRAPRTPLMTAKTSIFPPNWKYDIKREKSPPPKDDTMVVTVAWGKWYKTLSPFKLTKGPNKIECLSLVGLPSQIYCLLVRLLAYPRGEYLRVASHG